MNINIELELIEGFELSECTSILHTLLYETVSSPH
jgi:hypothetical protein